MTVSRIAGQAGGASGAVGSSPSKAFAGNVTAGNLIVVCGIAYAQHSSTGLAVGDCTKSAGTATIGTIALNSNITYKYDSTNYMSVAIWSVPVTGTGSCTMQVTSYTSWYVDMSINEYTSSLGSNKLTLNDHRTGSGASGAPATASGSSTANAVFCGATSNSGASNPITCTPGATYTQVYEEEDGADYESGNIEDKIVTGATSSTADWTAPTTYPWAAALAVYQEPAGATTYTLQCTTGAFTETGNNAVLLEGHKTYTTTGSFTLSGNNAIVLWAHKLFTTVNAFAWTGSNVIVLWKRKVYTTTGAFTWTGNNSIELWKHLVTTTTGAFTLTGNNSVELWLHKVYTTTGVYTWTGNNAILTYTSVGAYKLYTTTGTFNLSGQNAILLNGHKVLTTTGSYSWTGNNGIELWAHKLFTTTNAFAWTGNNAILIYVMVGSYLPGFAYATDAYSLMLVNMVETASSVSLFETAAKVRCSDVQV